MRNFANAGKGRGHFGRVWRAGVTAGAVALAANLLLFAGGRASGEDLALTLAGGATTTVTAVSVAIVSIFAALSGSALTVIVVRRWALASTARALRLSSITMTVLSLAGPLSAETTSGTRLLLVAMHLVTGLSFTWIVGRAASSLAEATRAGR